MKIVYVVQRYIPANLTGSEKVIATLAEATADQRNTTVTVISSDVRVIKGLYDPKLKALPKTGTVGKVNVRRLKINWFAGSTYHVIANFLPWLNRLTGGWLGFVSFGPHLMGLESAILAEKPDLIHTGPMPLFHVYETWKIARRHQIPLVITPMMHFDVSMFENPLIYSILSSVAALTTFTEFEKTELVKRGVTADKVTVVPATYIEAEAFSSGDGKKFRSKHGMKDEPIVLFLGTKAYDKGATHLLNIWPSVLAKIPDAKLVFAGASTMSWEKARSGSQTKIIDLNYIGGEEKEDLLAAASLLAVPSHTESFGIVVPEAWAKGKPVIVGPTGASKELVADGVDGFSVGFGDETALTARVIELLSDTKKRERMGEAGKKKARGLNKEAIVGKTLMIYKELIS